jgi:hypothetical protein
MGEAEEDTDFRPDRPDGRLIVDDQFVQRVQEAEDARASRPTTLNNIIKSLAKDCSIKKKDLPAPGNNGLASETQSTVALIVQEHPEITISEAATTLHRDTSSLCSGAAKLRAQSRRDGPCESALRIIGALSRSPHSILDHSSPSSTAYSNIRSPQGFD